MTRTENAARTIIARLLVAGSLCLVGAGCSEDEISSSNFEPTADELIAGTRVFADVTIPAGVKVTVVGDEPVTVFADDVLIEGTVDASGESGTVSRADLIPNGGDAGPGGGGGGGGGDCGNGIGVGGLPNGEDGTSDGGSGGLAFGLDPAVETPATGGDFGPGGGGGGGGGAATGGNGDETRTGQGFGGSAFSDATLSIFTGGGGGAGGGANGGGGGGGGGALRIIANSITVTSTGAILANGGSGAGKVNGACTSGGGGGGGGGMIWLDSANITVNGRVRAVGGAGGEEDQNGGVGSVGRILIDSGGGTVDTAGSSIIPAPNVL